MSPGGFKGFIVTIREHEIQRRSITDVPLDGTYTVPTQERHLCALGERGARRLGILDAHRDAGIPAWRPYLRESWPHTSARPAPSLRDELAGATNPREAA